MLCISKIGYLIKGDTKMNSQKYYWDEIFKARGKKTPTYDLWLDKNCV